MLNNNLKGITQNAFCAIENHAWPGNVRELEAVIKRAVIMAETPYIDDKDLGLENTSTKANPINLREVREKAEKDAIRYALNITSENISQAADLLGVSRPTLYDLIKKYQLK